MNEKFPSITTVRLTYDGEKMCRILMEKLGLQRTRLIEMAVRKLAEREGITKAEVDSYVLPDEKVK